MYWLLFAALVLAGAAIARAGLRRGRPTLAAAGVGVVLATVAFFALLSFWSELLWFEAVGYAPRFWRVLAAQLLTSAGGALLAFGAVYLLSLRAPARRPRDRWFAAAVAAAGGATWGYANWDRVLLFIHRAHTDLVDPVFGLDTGFYLFSLPLYDALYGLAFWIVLVALGAVLGLPSLVGAGRALRLEGRVSWPAVLVVAAAAAVVLAAGKLLDGYHLMYSDWGVVEGPGWTDVNVRLPAYRVLAVLILLAGALVLVPGIRQRIHRRIGGRIGSASAETSGLAAAAGVVGAGWLVGLVALPALVQWLVVEPNEITYEKPYIAHNIRFTRHGFGLHEVEERQYPATGSFTRETVADNRHLLSEVRLWDWRALDDVYRQFQEIRLYYAFADVDIDRYRIDGRYRQVMVSAREMAQGNLPRQSRTFVNLRFKYTHGYGLTMAAVSDFTAEGLPRLLVKDIPPQSQAAELAVTRPEIYFGELTDSPVVVNSREPEFDYPRGEENAYVRYAGQGGVRLDNLWRKFVLGWRLDGTRFLLSGYPTADSRVMYRREIRARVAAIAPFLAFDRDPYPVLVDGRLYWIIDAYTRSTYYPYSEPFAEGVSFGRSGRARGEASYLDGANYVRNAVKAVVDAYDGTVDFYVFAPDDPLIRTWQRALPGVFRDAAGMPAALRAHVRYPTDFLHAQGLVYARYHMGDPAVFYNQEDLWVRATEKYYDHVQPVEPYYVMWEQPGSDRAEFVLMQPFTPKNRQVLIGWIAGLCDGDNYGRFIAYKFPKERRVLGPQQVETKIDQDPFLSGQLTLWDQRGSQVLRGNVLAIPLDDSLLYVEPIYLRAETAAYPELRMVVVMHGDTMSYAETFDAAIEGLFDAGVRTAPSVTAGEGAPRDLAREAREAFDAYLEALGAQRFDDASAALGRLRDRLDRLVGQGGGTSPEAPR